MSVCQAALLVVSVVLVWYGMPAEYGTNIYICTYILLIWHVIGLDIKCEKIIHIKSHISSSNDYDCMICVCNCTVCIYYGYYYIYTKALLYVLTVMCSMLVVVHPNTLYISSSSMIHRSYVDGSHLKKPIWAWKFVDHQLAA